MQRVTRGCKGFRKGYKGLLGVTVGYKGLPGVTKGYKGFAGGRRVTGILGV